MSEKTGDEIIVGILDEADAEEGNVELLPSLKGDEGFDEQIIIECASLDTSDTDNAKRFLKYFGDNFLTISASGVEGGERITWCGKYWDLPNGAALAKIMASKVGDYIKLESKHLPKTPNEQKSFDRWAVIEGKKKVNPKEREELFKDLPDDPENKLAYKEYNAAKKTYLTRVNRRINHGITSKNEGRVENMLSFASSLTRSPHNDFNKGKLKVAFNNVTIDFKKYEDLDCPDPGIKRYKWELEVTQGHEKSDRLTSFIPFDWQGLEAKAPKFMAFLEEMLPDEEKRRTLQMYTGMGLTAIPLQYIMFHYGSGANGKSVFLETIFRILGDQIAVGLPRESIVGNGERGVGSASPDIMRLLFKRFVRILEVKGDVSLQDDLIKRLTGGEAMTARALFSGYIEFQNVAKAHMSGNQKPRFDGTDNGIVRRMLLIHWDQVVEEGKRKEFEDIVSEFIREESSGILAWLVGGVLQWLHNGEKLFVAQAVQSDTKEYVDENNPVGKFIDDCIVPSPGNLIPAKELHESFLRWATANSMSKVGVLKFGREISKRLKKSANDSERVYYQDIKTINIPPKEDDEAPATPFKKW